MGGDGGATTLVVGKEAGLVVVGVGSLGATGAAFVTGKRVGLGITGARGAALVDGGVVTGGTGPTDAGVTVGVFDQACRERPATSLSWLIRKAICRKAALGGIVAPCLEPADALLRRQDLHCHSSSVLA